MMDEPACRGRARPAALGLLLGLALVACAGTGAQAFDPSTLPAADRAFIEQMLEFEQTNQPRRLPASGAVVTIVRTEIQPQVCRYFSVSGGGVSNGQAKGCRIGNRQWRLSAVAAPVTPQPTRPIPSGPAPERPEISTALAPVPVVPATTAPAPPAVAAAGPPDVPRPGRRPGDFVPLVAAPVAMRTVPVPDRVPPRVENLFALAEVAEADTNSDADTDTDTAADTPPEAAPEEPPAAAAVAEAPRVPLPQRRPGSAPTIAVLTADNTLMDVPLPHRRPGSEPPPAVPAAPVANADTLAELPLPPRRPLEATLEEGEPAVPRPMHRPPPPG